MRNSRDMVLRSTTFLLLISLANVFVFAGVPAKELAPRSASGILTVLDMQTALVNGNIARDGTTILSGSEIKTDKSGVRIDLADLGSLDLAAETSATLTFASGQIALNLSEGQAQLTSHKGVSGVITTQAGEILKTDPSLETSTVGTNADPSKNAAKPWHKWSDGEKAALIIAIGVGVGITIYLVARETSKTR